MTFFCKINTCCKVHHDPNLGMYVVIRGIILFHVLTAYIQIYKVKNETCNYRILDVLTYSSIIYTNPNNMHLYLKIVFTLKM